jgi:hypothetical protein
MAGYADFTVRSKSKPEDATSYLPPAGKIGEMTLEELRKELEKKDQWIKANDKFLNRSGVAANEQMKAVDAANEAGVIIVEREVVQTPPPAPPPPPSEITYSVRRGKTGTGSNSSTATLKASATLKDLREFLTAKGFMKPTDWFATPAEIQIRDDESTKSAASAADKDTIIIGPWSTGTAGTTSGTIPQASTPTFPAGTWNTGITSNLPSLTSVVGTPPGGAATGTAAEQQRYISLAPKEKQSVFVYNLLDRGLVVRYDGEYKEDEQGRVNTEIRLDQSTSSPAWFVPVNSEEGPGPKEGAPANWDYFAAATRSVVELHSRGVHVATASGSYGDAGGLNGINFSGKYTQDHELRSRAESMEVYTVEQYTAQRVILEFDKADLTAKAEFVAAVSKIFASNQPRERQYESLHRDIFLEYGHFFPMEVVLGGKLLRTNHQTFTDVQSKERWLNEYAAGVGGKYTDESGGTITAQGSYGYSSTEERENALTKMYQNMRWINIGGSDYLAMDKTNITQWVNSLAPVSGWRPIEKRRLEPVISLLDEDSRRKCISLIIEFAESSITSRYTPLDMAVYVNYLLTKDLDGLNVI